MKHRGPIVWPAASLLVATALLLGLPEARAADELEWTDISPFEIRVNVLMKTDLELQNVQQAMPWSAWSSGGAGAYSPWPSSTVITLPVMNAPASETKSMSGPSISAGRPMRRLGKPSMTARPSSLWKKARFISVSM